MRIGIPKEIKADENRVAMIPAGVQQLTTLGHEVWVEHDAGVGSQLADESYVQAGAKISSAESVWSADLIVKVKEPQPIEYPYFRNELILFTFLHLAAEETLTNALLACGVTGIAYETVEIGRMLPLLQPMSEVAGRMATQIGAHFLEKQNGGRGILLGGVPGVPSAEVVILGAGTVGTQAARIALGMGASVTLIDNNLDRLRYLDELLIGRIQTLASNPQNIASAVAKADLLIGSVLIRGARAPKLVSRQLVSTMKQGSVIIDVAVDQGGCIETTHVTTHHDPTFIVDGVLHYGVANMPGAVPRTSTFALSNATLPYIVQLAKEGFQAIVNNQALRAGVNCHRGKICYKAVADAFALPYFPIDQLLS